MSKYVVSVSLGSSKRNHTVDKTLFGEKIVIERMGTDGDLNKAEELISSLDGKADAIGLGGIDLYIYAGKKRYSFRDAKRLANAAKKTPVVDGSGLKQHYEPQVIKDLEDEDIVKVSDKRVLMVCAMDRPGMAHTFYELGSDVIFGDLVFALGLNWPLRSLRALDYLARIIVPVLCRLPFKAIYPTGNKQEKESSPKHRPLYEWAEIIAGDYHFIKKHLPDSLEGKVIITNTLTSDDVKMLKDRHLHKIITTTPDLRGRSFGTNVIEAVLVAFINKPQELICPSDYLEIINSGGFEPMIKTLNP